MSTHKSFKRSNKSVGSNNKKVQRKSEKMKILLQHMGEEELLKKPNIVWGLSIKNL